MIGAPVHSLNTGRSYLVFGGPGVGSSGLITLSSLNGVTGFKLDGENNGDNICGAQSVNVGDINGDGYVDLLIRASDHSSAAGRSHVVFGGPGVGAAAISLCPV